MWQGGSGGCVVRMLRPAPTLTPPPTLPPPCQQGMCYTHTQACGGGAGLFLLLKVTKLLALRKTRATLLASPFVDAHGEEDPQLQRGRPLTLHPERALGAAALSRGAALDFDSRCLHTANARGETAAMY